VLRPPRAHSPRVMSALLSRLNLRKSSWQIKRFRDSKRVDFAVVMKRLFAVVTYFYS
jgi:hypothetical protein